MGGVFIFDCETTGFDAPQIIETALLPLPAVNQIHEVDRTGLLQSRYKPSKPISFGAKATHHIIEEDLEGCPSSDSFVLPLDTEYLIGHNIDFDWRAARAPEDVKRICTLALSRSIWGEQTDSCSLGAMMYFLFGRDAREVVKGAHNAGEDVMMTKMLLESILAQLTGIGDYHDLWEASENARIPKRMWFGKYGPKDGGKGMMIENIRRHDPGYHSWLLSGKCGQVNDDPYLKKALQRC